MKLGLDLVAVEQIILLAARALRAFKTAHKQQRHSKGHQDGEQIRICLKPLKNDTHKPIKKTD